MNSEVITIIVNWNGINDTVECLDSLERAQGPSNQVIVVDNGSTDRSVEEIRRQYPDTILLETGQNLGYAGGNNVGLKFFLNNTTSEYVLILNNDVVVAPDFLNHLVTVLESNSQIKAVTPTIYYYDRPNVIWGAGGMLDQTRFRPCVRGVDEQDLGQFGQPFDVDFGLGCALLCRRSLISDIGFLDERFFLYSEEVEWCLRIVRAGFRITHVPSSRIWHKTKPAGEPGPPYREYYQTRNHFLLLRIAHAGWHAWFDSLVNDVLRPTIVWTVRAKYRHLRPERNARLQGMLDFVLGRFGRRF